MVDIMELRPALFECLADEDEGHDPNKLETGLLRDRFAIHGVYARVAVLGMGLQVLATGLEVLGMGLWVLATGLEFLGMGLWVLATGLEVLGMGLWVLATGLWALATGLLGPGDAPMGRKPRLSPTPAA